MTVETSSAYPAFPAVPKYLQLARQGSDVLGEPAEKEEEESFSSQGEEARFNREHAEEAEEAKEGVNPLVAYAAALAPEIHLTVVETPDEDADRAMVQAMRAAIDRYPGENAVITRAVLLDGTVIRVRWHALDCRELRMDLASLLSHRARGVGV